MDSENDELAKAIEASIGSFKNEKDFQFAIKSSLEEHNRELEEHNQKLRQDNQWLRQDNQELRQDNQELRQYIQELRQDNPIYR